MKVNFASLGLHEPTQAQLIQLLEPHLAGNISYQTFIKNYLLNDPKGIEISFLGVSTYHIWVFTDDFKPLLEQRSLFFQLAEKHSSFNVVNIDV